MHTCTPARQHRKNQTNLCLERGKPGGRDKEGKREMRETEAVKVSVLFVCLCRRRGKLATNKKGNEKTKEEEGKPENGCVCVCFLLSSFGQQKRKEQKYLVPRGVEQRVADAGNVCGNRHLAVTPPILTTCPAVAICRAVCRLCSRSCKMQPAA